MRALSVAGVAAAISALISSTAHEMAALRIASHHTGAGKRTIPCRRYRDCSKYMPAIEDRKHGLFDNLPPRGTDLR